MLKPLLTDGLNSLKPYDILDETADPVNNELGGNL